MRGYPISYGSPDGWAACRQQFLEVFGVGAGDVRVVRFEHLLHSGLDRPRWDITLTGVPEGQPVFTSPRPRSGVGGEGGAAPPPPPSEPSVSECLPRCKPPPPLQGY